MRFPSRESGKQLIVLMTTTIHFILSHLAFLSDTYFLERDEMRPKAILWPSGSLHYSQYYTVYLYQNDRIKKIQETWSISFVLLIIKILMILIFTGFISMKHNTPKQKIFSVNVNVIRQPSATTHFRWRARLAFRSQVIFLVRGVSSYNISTPFLLILDRLNIHFPTENLNW